MPSPSHLKPSAPSASLLRFLRSQSEFCAPSLSACTHSVRRRLHTSRQAPCNAAPSASPNKIYSETGPCRATVQASIFTIPCVSARSHSTSRSRLSFDQPQSIRSPSIVPFANTLHSRSVTTKSRPLLRRLFELRRSKPATDSKLNRSGGPALIDDGTEGGFNIGRGLAAKATNEPRLRCTEFDNNGNVTLVNGEFKKSELIAKVGVSTRLEIGVGKELKSRLQYGLLPRDLRKIDSSTLPHILVRPSAILINLLHLRVLIKHDRVLVFDAYGSTDSYMQSLFVYDLEGKLRQKQTQGAGALPYEFRALEAVLISVTAGLEEEFNGVREPVVRVLRALEEDIDRDKLRHLLIYSKKLGTFEQKARLVRDAIDDLLEADDDLTAMYLTERANGVEREEDDHQEVEMLLESYHKVCDEIVQASGNLVTSIRNTEEVVKAILDANRNSLMLLDLKFSIGTLGLATGTLFSALYGMNLKNFIEESDAGFGAVSVTCFAITAVVCVYGLAKLRKLQRVRMWGEAGAGGTPINPITARNGILSSHRANWRADSIEPVWGSLPGEGRTERMKRIRDSAAAAAAKSLAADAAAQRASALRAASAQAKASASASASSGSAKGSGHSPTRETDPTGSAL
ncbi:CorA family magnesium transporter [Aspergillus clavatus NRRL 1]|uniref:Magnesium transporter n=1 Tax=Aspergillus clavatus (strain ATCC 1007 / CBS 513.65 / DSM 816 / NCTC 3887 / NRRL 1 / QM 1276 / 107) TaxID=344612 RepID=A1CMR2_ASPCL|nr:magnesium ion transporter (Mrs2), putative [Aspergillus clavatus NRRL 1]EAW08849.1 magnesium ion transporter (Mrs2), putative [Aspergillus clavatus NRRL 1]